MFLQSRAQILAKIDDLVSASHAGGDRLRAAVAFWGEGAQVMARGKGPHELICNLSHPGTNPGVIETIMRQPNVVFRQRDDLHAKVAISAGGAVVGSANFSEKALGLQMAEVGGWIEAGFFIEPGTAPHGEVDLWFDSIWAGARAITSDDIEQAKQRWIREGGKPYGPELFEEDVFETLPLGAKSRNKTRMASAELARIYYRAFPGEVENKATIKVPAHAANLLWLLSGRVARTNIEGMPYFLTPDMVANRARDLKTFDKVQAFLVELANNPALRPKPAIAHWAKYGANLDTFSLGWYLKGE